MSRGGGDDLTNPLGTGEEYEVPWKLMEGGRLGDCAFDDANEFGGVVLGDEACDDC